MAREQVGIIDVGSNTIKLLIAENDPNTVLRSVRFEVEETRIGERMTGSPPSLGEDAIRKGVQAIARLSAIAREHSLRSLRIVATSAARDASDQDHFARLVAAETGIELEILSGQEEARLIGKGIQLDPELATVTRYTLLDLGGGSMECIHFSNLLPEQSISLDLGAVRLSSEYVSNRHVPLPLKEAEAIQARVKSALTTAGLQPHAATAVLTGGAANVIAAQRATRSEGRPMSLQEARQFKERVCALEHAQRIEQLQIPPSRADIFPAAATILCEALDHLGCQTIHFSRYNLRYGLAAEMLEELF